MLIFILLFAASPVRGLRQLGYFDDNIVTSSPTPAGTHAQTNSTTTLPPPSTPVCVDPTIGSPYSRSDATTVGCGCDIVQSLPNVPPHAQIGVDTRPRRPCYSTWNATGYEHRACTSCFLGSLDTTQDTTQAEQCLSVSCAGPQMSSRLFLLGDSHCWNIYTAMVIALRPRLCQAGVITQFVPGTDDVAYADADHLNDAGSAYFWPFLCSFMQTNGLLSGAPSTKCRSCMRGRKPLFGSLPCCSR